MCTCVCVFDVGGFGWVGGGWVGGRVGALSECDARKKALAVDIFVWPCAAADVSQRLAG